MLAVGRALMSDPQLIMLDEPSMGLAPILVDEVFHIISQINAEGKTVLLVEQNAFRGAQHSGLRIRARGRRDNARRHGARAARRPARDRSLPRRLTSE